MASTSSSSSRAGSRTKKITGVPEPEIPIVVEEVDDPVESAEILQGVAEEEDGEESDEYELEDDSDSGEEYEEEDDDGPSLTALLLVNPDQAHGIVQEADDEDEYGAEPEHPHSPPSSGSPPRSPPSSTRKRSHSAVEDDDSGLPGLDQKRKRMATN